nr:hypothetical protein [Candidatus Sigynarchaeota archaeon]
MGESKQPSDKTSWLEAFREQLKKNPDPSQFQAEVIRILLDVFPAPEEKKHRAIDKHAGTARSGFLPRIFGDTARVKILEALLQYPDDWFTLTDLATIAGAGKASAKRIVDEIKASKLDIVEEQGQQGKERERLVKLKDTQLARELRFFYMKLRGLC